MLKRKTNKKGFTIMEMLIVVAIIAVLAAIAIPTFNSALVKAKESADVANVRAAYAEIQVAHLTDDEKYPDKNGFKAMVDLNYEDKLDYTAPTATADGKIEYTATKLENKESGKVFSWTLEKSTATAAEDGSGGGGGEQ